MVSSLAVDPADHVRPSCIGCFTPNIVPRPDTRHLKNILIEKSPASTHCQKKGIDSPAPTRADHERSLGKLKPDRPAKALASSNPSRN